MDELVMRANAARDRLVRVRAEASRDYAKAVADVVADEVSSRGDYGAQARAARRLDLSSQRIGELVRESKELQP